MLETINYPSDLKKIKIKDLPKLCAEIREKIIASVNECGGHLASNLGTVELTVAMHYALSTPKDKLIFDVGHQCYAHKILTGRKGAMGSLRKHGGISGFTNPKESEYDAVYAGHSSTSLSQALGFCRARDLRGESYNVAAVIGDASLSSGMSFEALNNIGSYGKKLIIVINDNEMSISKNVGALGSHLSKMRISPHYRGLKRRFSKFLLAIPLIGKPLKNLFERVKNFFADLFIKSNIFHAFGISYAGVFDGNDVIGLIKTMRKALQADKPFIIHLRTKKGKGYAPAEDCPEEFHSVKKCFNSSQTAMSAEFGKKLCEIAHGRKDIVAVTAAMKNGTGLNFFADKFGDRFFDVGICEQHAVTMCAGMAHGGLKPYFAVYSTFLQRAFDQISNDICLPGLPVTLMIDRAGLCGADGETHHGVFDVPYLTMLPGMTVIAPRDLASLRSALEFSADFNRPLAIRYENEYFDEFDISAQTIYGKWTALMPVTDINIVAYGNRALTIAYRAAQSLKAGGIDAGVIDAAFIKPIDGEMVKSLTGSLIVVEDSVPGGSLFSAVSAYAARESLKLRLFPMTLPDKYIGHGNSIKLLEQEGISEGHITEKVRQIIDGALI